MAFCDQTLTLDILIDITGPKGIKGEKGTIEMAASLIQASQVCFK